MTPIELARERMGCDSLRLVMEKLGFGTHFKRSCKSPFRDEKRPSWGVFQGENGKWLWKDHGTGESGDELDFIVQAKGCSSGEAVRMLCEMAGVDLDESNGSNGAPTKGATVPAVKGRGQGRNMKAEVHEAMESGKEVKDWTPLRAALTDELCGVIAEARGYRPEFVRHMRDHDFIGWYENGPAFPVKDDNGVLQGAHFKKDGEQWMYTKTKIRGPLVFGALENADGFFAIAESQWDALAILDAYQADKIDYGNWSKMFSLIVTRGHANAKALGSTVSKLAKVPGVRAVIVEQNDPPRPDGKATGNDQFVKHCREVCAEHPELFVRSTKPPEGIKDFNDWLLVAPYQDVAKGFSEAKINLPSKFSIRVASELLEMHFDDSDCYMGDRVIAASQGISFLGAGGIGKSRLTLQLAISMCLGIPFMGFETRRAKGLRWLIIQTENSNRRYHFDLKKMVKGMGLTDGQIRQLSECIFIHTIETEQDGFLDLADSETVKELKALVAAINPTFVMFDPLNSFSSEDINSDKEMRAVCVAISQITKFKNPNRVPFIVHHALTGKQGAAKAVGWDKASFGRNSKALYAWARSQINVAPRDPENENLLIMTCGKNNNGKTFPPIGIIFDDEAGVYRVDEDFDADDFRERI